MDNNKDKSFEEIAEIPEKIAVEQEIEIDGQIFDSSEHDSDNEKEEINDSIDSFNGAKTIEDEYIVDGSIKDKYKNSPDLSFGVKKSKILEKGKTTLKENSAASDAMFLNDKIKKKLPDDFNIHEIGNIDLREAEAIANEDILFLTEEDLVEGLEDFDLIPLEGNGKKNDTVKKEPAQARVTNVVAETAKKTGAEIKAAPKIETDLEHRKSFIEIKTGETPEKGKDREIGKSPDQIAKKRPEIKPEQKVNKPFAAPVPEENEEYIDLTVDSFEEKQGAPSYRKPERVVQEKISSDGTLTTGEKKIEKSFDDDEFIRPLDDFPDDLRDLEREDRIHDSELNFIDDSEKEIIPLEYKKLEERSSGVKFVDDGLVDKPETGSGMIFDDDELEKLTGDIFEVIEGRAKTLIEAEIDEDKELVAHMLTGITPAFEDLLLEFDEEYKYIDDEIDFIHTVIVEDDYSNYIKYIDEYHGIKSKRKVTSAIELIGLTFPEIESVEEKLFFEEYKDVNLVKIFDFFKTDQTSADGRVSIEKNCTYILYNPQSLLDDEKESIENDISSPNALIFEEDVEDIRRLLSKTIGAERAAHVEVIDNEVADKLYDITDQIVIIEDELDVDRFIKEFPGEKQDEIKMLLKYLDGLFEKLPREILRKFVNSEYFDLYIKVLTELGV